MRLLTRRRRTRGATRHIGETATAPKPPGPPTFAADLTPGEIDRWFDIVAAIGAPADRHLAWVMRCHIDQMEDGLAQEAGEGARRHESHAEARKRQAPYGGGIDGPRPTGKDVRHQRTQVSAEEAVAGAERTIRAHFDRIP